MGEIFIPKPTLDYKQMRLCCNCWNTKHYHREMTPRDVAKGSKVGHGKIIIDCTGGDCECPCRQLLAEKHPRVKPDHKNKIPMFA